MKEGRTTLARLLGLAVTCLSLLVAGCVTPEEGQPEAETQVAAAQNADILAAIRMVESGGDDACPDGDGGRAIGPFQIHRAYWLDAAEEDPSLGPSAGHDYQDCRDRAYAERVVEAYMSRYASEAWARGDAETLARIHNGGPRGAEKPQTVGYWHRVRRALGSVR